MKPVCINLAPTDIVVKEKYQTSEHFNAAAVVFSCRCKNMLFVILFASQITAMFVANSTIYPKCDFDNIHIYHLIMSLNILCLSRLYPRVPEGCRIIITTIFTCQQLQQIYWPFAISRYHSSSRRFLRNRM